MASLAEGRCTCEEVWLGTGRRPACVLHEADELPPGYGRRRDGTVVNILATIGTRRGRARDPEGMGGTWREWP